MVDFDVWHLYQAATRSISVKTLSGDKNVYVRYSGQGGVRLNSFWKKMLFAWHQLDTNILISSYMEPENRIQFWRPIKERVRRVAPFLRLDRDPYLVISKGRLFWIQDAYTVSSMFPYSEPSDSRFNYIRNSVKVVVDASEGDLILYVIDQEDPVLGVYGTEERLPAEFPIPIDTIQTPQARTVLKAAEEALRIGDWKGFENSMQMLKDLLSEQ